MKQEPNLRSILSLLKTNVIELFHTKIELLKLETFEKTSRVGAFLIYGLIILNFLFFIFFFAFIALGFLIGDRIQSIAGGFAVVTLIYSVLLAITVACRKSILTSFQNLFLKELDPNLKNKNEYEHQLKKDADELD
jgi:uncharacterized membrane protein YqjE